MSSSDRTENCRTLAMRPTVSMPELLRWTRVGFRKHNCGANGETDDPRARSCNQARRGRTAISAEFTAKNGRYYRIGPGGKKVLSKSLTPTPAIVRVGYT